MDDSFFTIADASEGLFKDKGSKFIAYAFPVNDEETIKDFLDQVKKDHHSARHHCYAWRLGVEKDNFRMNDDGEPSSTAGKPIFGQIKSFNLTNILVIVVRYFGGTLLGVSGLINAYKNAAADALTNAQVIEQLVMVKFIVHFEYPQMGEVMRVMKRENLPQEKTDFKLHCSISSSVRQKEIQTILEKFNQIVNVTAEIIF